MKNKLFKSTLARPLAVAAIIACTATASHAAIMVVATDSLYFGNSISTNTLPNFTVAAGNDRKLVVSIGYESAAPTSITYGMQTFTPAVVVGNTRTTQIYYLDAPNVGTADIVVTFPNAAGSRIGVLSLTGAATLGPVVSNTSNNGSATISLTTTAADTFVVGGLTVNSGALGSPSAFTNLYNGNSRSSTSDAGYVNEAVAGLKTYTWTTTETGTGIGGIAVAGFAAVPEPTSAALLGSFGGLALLRRRR